jgi:ABC-2 type transport system permease protein
MNPVQAVFRREFASYFATPLATVFIVIFLLLAGVFTFYLGDLYETGQADLQPFFRFHPWLYLLLVPALSMRLWAEERKSGSLELLLTLPLSRWQAVLGKFLAAWAFLGLALVLTVPVWATVAWLGEPDHGVILASYAGSWLMGGAMLALGGCLSAMTRSQVVAFVLSAMACLLLLLAGFPLALNAVREIAPQSWVDAIGALSYLTHYQAITRGVLDLRDLVFFLAAIVAWLLATAAIIELKQAD